MNRSDLALQLKNEAMVVIPELQSEFYKKKKYEPMYSKFCNVKKISDLEWTSPKRGGGSAYTIQTSLIGVTEFHEIGESEPVKFQDPALGFPIYVKKRKFGLGVELTVEANRDFKALKTELMNWIKEQNFPEALMLTKERAAAGMINTGAYTAGSSYFDNSIPGIINPSYGSVAFDGKPLFNLSTNLRTNKIGSTYYNHVGSLNLTFENLVTADTLLQATNAKTENDTPFRNDLDNFIMFNPALRLSGMRIVNSTLVPENNNNDVNPLNGAYKPISNPYMTSTTAWVIGNKYGLYFFDSDDIMIDVWKVNETDLLRLKAVVYLAYAVFDWRALVASNLATS